MKYFVVVVILIVAVAVVAGFFIVGSPKSERRRQFDQQRINDLSNIQWQIINYWQAKNKLPATLDDLKDPIGGFLPPVDPETGDFYGYEARSPLSFVLCANFNLEATDEARLKGEQIIWDHPAGRHCFQRAIDPDLYQPRRSEKPF